MKNIRYKHLRGILFPFLVAMLILMAACEDDKVGAPVITSVRNYAASPDDTLVTTIQSGQWVVIHGQNLGDVSQVYFSTVLASVNSALFTDESIVVQIPAIPFESVPASQKNEITVISEGGVDTYSISVVGPPLIMRVRNYADSPNDTIVNSLVPGQHINLVGFNLEGATEISFLGLVADLSNVIYTDTSAIIQVPEDLSGGLASMIDLIGYTTEFGSGSFFIKIIGPPVIVAISNENPQEGTTVSVYGNNFVDVQSLTFAGESITEFEVSEDEQWITFTVPPLSQSGPVSITTLSGSFTTVYNVNDVVTGIVSNYEWGDNFRWEWWGGANLVSNLPEFPGNSTQYLSLKTNIMDPGAGDEFSTAIRVGDVQWLPVGNLNDPVGSWALKFEFSIPEAWNGASLVIKSSFTNNYMARIEPWRVSPSKTADFTTSGWQTITIPLSAFRKNDATLGDGMGTPLEKIVDLIGASGNSKMVLYLHNYEATATKTSFYGAFDNLRLVRR